MARLLLKLFNFKRILSPKITKTAFNDMDKVFVRHIEGEERMQLSFTYKFDTGAERTFNMNRRADELLSDSLARMCNNVTAILEKKAKKKKKRKEEAGELEQKDTASLVVMLCNEENLALSGGALNSEAWKPGSVLSIGDTKYEVVVNPPTIKKLELPSSIMAGFPTAPKIDLEFANLNSCQYTWFKGSHPQASASKNDSAASCPEKQLSHSDVKDWTELDKGFVYMPSNTDVGFFLKVVCLPVSEDKTGIPVEAYSKKEVTASPGFCPFENRHLLTDKRVGTEGVRVVTYNILADLYADSDFSRGFLFPYCPHYALEIDYRKQLFLKEIIGYNADVICLQEVDRKVFLHDLLPVLNNYGMEGVLCEKTGETREGTATFYMKDKFRLIGEHSIGIAEALGSMTSVEEVRTKISANESLQEKVNSRSSKLQVLALERLECPGDVLLVGTTHLYFHPKAGHIRLLQAYTCAKHLEQVRASYQSQNYKVSTLFCGDLNSPPWTGVVQLLTTGRVGAEHHDWYTGGQEDYVLDLNISQPFKFSSACGYPDYTNFVTSFCGCLDYIFVEDDSLKVDRVIPLPYHQEVTQFTALPNPVFPSDHLALVCDLMWNN